MRKMQAELSFEDSNYKMSRALEQMSAPTLDFIEAKPMPRSSRMKVVCLECSRKFSTSNAIPSCPGCGGSDIDLA